MELRGRNGWANVGQTHVLHLRGNNDVCIDVYSGRHGRNAPVVISGKPDEVKRWLAAVTRAVESGQCTIISKEVWHAEGTDSGGAGPAVDGH